MPLWSRVRRLGAVALAFSCGAAAGSWHTPPGRAPVPTRASQTHSAAAREPALPLAFRCAAPGVVPKPRGTGGGTIALAPFDDLAAVADGDNDAVAILALDAQGDARPLRAFGVGRAPAQVVLGSDGRVFVTERQANTLSVYDSRTGRALCRADVAADPVGVALSPDERTVYVTSGLTHTLSALDTHTLSLLYVLDVPREPRGVRLSPDGALAFIAHVAGEPLSVAELSMDHAELRELPPIPVPADPPRQRRVVFRELFQVDLIEKPDGGDFPVVTPPPLTSRPAPHPRPSAMDFPVVAVPPPPLAGRSTDRVVPQRPASFAQVQRPMPDRAELLATRDPFGRPLVRPVPSQAWSVAIDAERGKALVPFMVNRTGRELPAVERLDVYGGRAVTVGPEPEKLSFAVASYDLRTGRWDRVVLPEGRVDDGRPRVRIPSSIAVRASDHALLVTAMGSDAVATLAQPAGESSVARETDVRGTLAGPCGIAVTRGGTELVFSQFDHAVEVRNARGVTRVAVGDDPLPAEVAHGRRLFFSATDPRLASGGLSCGGCHADGRDDGLTWFLSQGPRQTPTLAGRMVAPFNWNGTQHTLQGNITQTLRRLGGHGVKPVELDALAAFLSRGLRVPERPERALDAFASRGRELFFGAGACGACHDPDENFTDGVTHVLGHLRADESRREFDTPSLRFVGATAPYFHDGRYETLEELLSDPSHRMGHVERFSSDDVLAVAAYLRTL